MDSRRQFVDRMFRARVSWTLVGGIGLIGLTNELSSGFRGALLGIGVAVFVWLNHPLLRWVMTARRVGDPSWKPMALGLVLRVFGLLAVIVISW